MPWPPAVAKFYTLARILQNIPFQWLCKSWTLLL